MTSQGSLSKILPKNSSGSYFEQIKISQAQTTGRDKSTGKEVLSGRKIQRSTSKGLYNTTTEFTTKSAPKDTIDAIYKKKDPITASIELRKESGSILSVQKPKTDSTEGLKFFYSLSLVGPGLKKPKKINLESSPSRKPKKLN